ncbi:cdp-diacylglycerol-serine O-phosphatidyltransferase-like protein [Sodiomyces alkalinus F11]|uniref:CDP-diacylglycerol--serine O-phosphatidyltransferase n=1 Tax=Sodiomyces alkalinus (strain CBS 110278 / VKM F-3762 / F11) TaxID=1314773 RepID=A0A3N2Q7J2_SODAK|nr:cdp-diacylglycerol-serine O-phosphatidyltransferase-like protein [Sodiomyces alkalinus F11]ROT42712.1 cdp-diacylglycerol-serine O-phosphatidyltransferase-like protein [Sodiomyces alkalinus F11]
MSKRTSSAVVNGIVAKDGGSDLSPPDKQKLLLSADTGHLSLVRAMHLADLITLCNGACGTLSVFSSLAYCLGDPNDLHAMYRALLFLPLGLFFDFLDGKVARWRKKSSLMGQELDSLADLISFGVAPAAAAFALGIRTPLDQLFLAFFVLCGLARLARFNVTVAALPRDASGKSAYFEGTPIPTTLALDGIMAYWIHKGTVLGALPFGIALDGSPLAFHTAALMFVVHGCLMTSRSIRIPKP